MSAAKRKTTSARRHAPGRCRGCEARAEELRELRKENRRLVELLARGGAAGGFGALDEWSEAEKAERSAEAELGVEGVSQEEFLEAFHSIHGRGVFEKTLGEELNEAMAEA